MTSIIGTPAQWEHALQQGKTKGKPKGTKKKDTSPMWLDNTDVTWAIAGLLIATGVVIVAVWANNN